MDVNHVKDTTHAKNTLGSRVKKKAKYFQPFFTRMHVSIVSVMFPVRRVENGHPQYQSLR